MPESSVSRPTKINVFDKLNTDYGDDSPLAKGLNLQYPSDLGSDEYNQFILFTVYEKNPQNIINAQRKTTNARDEFRILLDQNGEAAGEAFRTFIQSGPGYQAGKEFAQGIPFGELVMSALDGGVEVTSELVEWFNSAEFQTYLSSDPELQAAFKNYTDLRAEESETLANTEVLSTTQNIKNFEKKTAKPVGQAGSEYRKYYGDLGLRERSAGGYRSRGRFGAAAYQQGTNVALYLPNKLVNNGSISYAGVNFEVIRNIKDTVEGDLAGLGPTLKRGVSSIVSDVLGFVGVDVNAPEAITAITGLAINPREEQVFQGVSTRTFDFTFSLAPRNPSEAVEINKIIREFRKYSHPSTRAGAFFLTVPAEFDIRYYKITPNGIALENLFLNRIGRCSLTNINVDYTPNGINATFEDGSPVRTSVTMTFTELRPLVREDIEEGF